MDGKDLVKKLQRSLARLSSKQRLTPQEVAQTLGLTPQTITNWQNNNNLRAADISNAFAKAHDTAYRKAQSEAIKPVIEFFRVEPTSSLQGAKWELFTTVGNGEGQHPYRQGLKVKL